MDYFLDVFFGSSLLSLSLSSSLEESFLACGFFPFLTAGFLMMSTSSLSSLSLDSCFLAACFFRGAAFFFVFSSEEDESE
jgi:hypothetical protein